VINIYFSWFFNYFR